MIPKFRAWDTFHNEWVEHFYITENGLIYNMLQQHRDLIGAVPIEKSGLIVMQSTGLFDSLEPPKEIFEGDIVKLHHFITRYDEYGGAYEDEEEIIGVIHYGYNEVELKYYGKVYPPKWFIETKNCSYTLESIGGIHEESFTVLGNIHQHQHLLENLK